MDKEKLLAELAEDILHNSLIRDELIERKCIDYLRMCGYKVLKNVMPVHKNVKSTQDLVQFFYALVDYTYPSAVGYYRNRQKDMKIASRFIESRMEMASISKEEALRQCTLIIEALFRHINEFDFKDKPLNLSIFGQESMGWLTERLIGLVLKEEEEKRRDYHKQLEQEILDKVLEEKGEEYLRLEGI